MLVWKLYIDLLCDEGIDISKEEIIESDEKRFKNGLKNNNDVLSKKVLSITFLTLLLLPEI